MLPYVKLKHLQLKTCPITVHMIHTSGGTTTSVNTILGSASDMDAFTSAVYAKNPTRPGRQFSLMRVFTRWQKSQFLSFANLQEGINNFNRDGVVYGNRSSGLPFVEGLQHAVVNFLLLFRLLRVPLMRHQCRGPLLTSRRWVQVLPP